MDELHLFIHNIKPAVLVSPKFNMSSITGYGNFIYTKIGGTDGIPIDKEPESILIHREPVTITSMYEIGVALGFYPKACVKHFHEFIPEAIGLYFHGIRFNTCNFFKESLDWCLTQYGEKILNLDGFIFIKIFYKCSSKKYDGFVIGDIPDNRTDPIINLYICRHKLKERVNNGMVEQFSSIEEFRKELCV